MRSAFLGRMAATVAGVLATGLLLYLAGNGVMGKSIESLAKKVTAGYGV